MDDNALDAMQELLNQRDTVCHSIVGIVYGLFRYGAFDGDVIAAVNRQRIAELLLHYDVLTERIYERAPKLL